jgi:hypothetical protein
VSAWLVGICRAVGFCYIVTVIICANTMASFTSVRRSMVRAETADDLLRDRALSSQEMRATPATQGPMYRANTIQHPISPQPIPASPTNRALDSVGKGGFGRFLRELVFGAPERSATVAQSNQLVEVVSRSPPRQPMSPDREETVSPLNLPSTQMAQDASMAESPEARKSPDASTKQSTAEPKLSPYATLHREHLSRQRPVLDASPNEDEPDHYSWTTISQSTRFTLGRRTTFDHVDVTSLGGTTQRRCDTDDTGSWFARRRNPLKRHSIASFSWLSSLFNEGTISENTITEEGSSTPDRRSSFHSTSSSKEDKIEQAKSYTIPGRSMLSRSHTISPHISRAMSGPATSSADRASRLPSTRRPIQVNLVDRKADCPQVLVTETASQVSH